MTETTNPIPPLDPNWDLRLPSTPGIPNGALIGAVIGYFVVGDMRGLVAGGVIGYAVAKAIGPTL